MLKFYLPYSGIDCPDSILVHGDTAMRFPSRKAALAFVVEHYRDEPSATNQAIVSIEGQDGLWRSFDRRLLPASEHG
ncbi:hypothetical protein [Dyella sp.]|uniref:hypothetical protein n=1 Tax=Dyella sp. TaxID=1869338 RepID=UPI002B46F3D1|nr:hypothetical protein [Dyella sp.]HKT29745.1 hypothetical protein [Dyella sp.]